MKKDIHNQNIEIKMDAETTKTLARIEEQLRNIEVERLKNIEADLREIKIDQKQNYVSRAELELVKQKNIEICSRLEKVESGIGKVVWLVLSTVILAILYLIIK